MRTRMKMRDDIRGGNGRDKMEQETYRKGEVSHEGREGREVTKVRGHTTHKESSCEQGQYKKQIGKRSD
jgi:hypothetical protein